MDLSYAAGLGEKTGEYLSDARCCLQKLTEKDCAGAELSGWLNWPQEHGFGLLSQIVQWKRQLNFSWDCVVVCGIGGSFAGTRAVESALSNPFLANLETTQQNEGLRPVYYCGHDLSEKNLAELIRFLDEKSPIICIISKSGTTTEPGAAFRVLHQYMDARYGHRAAARITAVTDREQGGLRAMAAESHYSTFEIPASIGGRFSVLSAVGLVPLALAGFDVRRLCEGADHVFRSLGESASAKDQDQPPHPVLQLAAFRKAAFEAGYRLDILSYREPGMAAFAEWWKQLFGESEGKNGKGLFPAGMQYPTDLHSLGQFLQEGSPCMIQTFLEADQYCAGSGILEERIRIPHLPGGKDGLNYLEGYYIDEINAAAMKAGMRAHSSRGIPCARIHYPQTDLWSLGALFAFFQTACALSALMSDLNPFDQPGVEAYKKQMFRILGRPGYEP